MSKLTRLDRLEVLAETILLAIQQQKEQQDRDQQEFREPICTVASRVKSLTRRWTS